jgi:opacity protein-like surface antigen
VMLNAYYDFGISDIQPYVMGGVGYGVYSTKLKYANNQQGVIPPEANTTGQYKLRNIRGYTMQVGTGAMKRLAPGIHLDVGVRVGTQKNLRKKQTTTIDGYNTVTNKYNLVGNGIIGLKFDL